MIFGSGYRNCFFLKKFYSDIIFCYQTENKKTAACLAAVRSHSIRACLWYSFFRLVNKYIRSVLLHSVLLRSDWQKSRVLFFRSLNRQNIDHRRISLTLFLPLYQLELLKLCQHSTRLVVSTQQRFTYFPYGKRNVHIKPKYRKSLSNSINMTA